MSARLFAVGVGVMTVLLAAGCAAGGPAGTLPADPTEAPKATALATPSAPAVANVDVDPAVDPKPLPGECRTYGTVTDRVPISLKAHARNAQAVVHGVIVDLGAPQWNTPAGAPPTFPDTDALHVMRLARIDVKGTLAGTATSSVVAIPGGKIGCSDFRIDLVPNDIRIGSDVLLFLSGSPDRGGMEGVTRVTEVWPVVDDWIVVPDSGTKIPLEVAASEMQP
ncbi:MAG: hypothetical protein H0V74_01665 [Chloroflexi bacterium]|nr:hypothetical protein [Chloroflexota bacterium]